MKSRLSSYGFASAVLILFSILPYASCAQAQSPGAQNPLPRGTKFTATGEVRTATIMRAEAVGATNAMAQPKSDKYELPILNPKDYNEQAIEASLTTLTKWTSGGNKYSLYFQMMPWGIDIRSEASALLTMPHDTEYVLKHWTLANTNIGIRTVIPSSISNLPPFQQSPGDAIFVKLDGFGYAVPISVARLVEANFIDGFVTRLVLNAYQKIYSQQAYGTVNLKLGIGDLDPIKGYSNAFASASTYTTPPNQLLQVYIATQLESAPINSIAMIYGWKAADELVREDDSSLTLQKAAWSLLNYRHSFRSIGEITGYTLNYLNGFALNENIAAGGSIGTIKQLDALIAKVKADQKVVGAKQFLASFQNVMVAEFYAVSQNNKLKPNQRTNLLAEYSNFIDGFAQGTQKAADVIYNEVADLSYGLGYAAGFRDGYALGYTTGWADGYASGNAAAWAQASQIIQGLQQQIADLQSQLNNSSGGGFWDTVGNIANDVGTAVGIIGSLF
jgi:hypothetical protein